MPRKPRFFIPGMPVHAVQRGHNRSAVFFADFDYLEYLRFLKKAADDCSCAIHAYILMTNHVHLLITPAEEKSVGRLFQSLGRHYVRYVNTTYQRHGALWEGRYKSNLIESQSYFLACMRYIEMNPVRAGIAKHPADYRWSSYTANALGVDNAIITPHHEYLALGSSQPDRQISYRGLFDAKITEDELDRFRAVLQSGTPLGNDRFKAEVEAALGMKTGYDRPGRPKKSL